MHHTVVSTVQRTVQLLYQRDKQHDHFHAGFGAICMHKCCVGSAQKFFPFGHSKLLYCREQERHDTRSILHSAKRGCFPKRQLGLFILADSAPVVVIVIVIVANLARNERDIADADCLTMRTVLEQDTRAQSRSTDVVKNHSLVDIVHSQGHRLALGVIRKATLITKMNCTHGQRTAPAALEDFPIVNADEIGFRGLQNVLRRGGAARLAHHAEKNRLIAVNLFVDGEGPLVHRIGAVEHERQLRGAKVVLAGDAAVSRAVAGHLTGRAEELYVT